MINEKSIDAETMNEQLQFSGVYPASSIQYQFWILYQLNPESSAYNIPFIYHIKGNFNVHTLKRTWEMIINRHSTFRTVFQNQQDQLCQFILKKHHFDIQQSECFGYSAEKIDKAIQNEIERPFLLHSAPPLRVKVLTINEDEAILIIVMHHIVTDLKTKDLFCKEFADIYESVEMSQPLNLQSPNKQYFQYAEKHQHWLNSGANNKMLEFWDSFLSDSDSVLDLPVDYKYQPGQTSLGKAHPIHFPVSFTREIKEYCRQKKVNVFLLLLTAFCVILHRYSRQVSFCIGVPFTNRRDSEHENTLGCFVNILPLPISFADNPSFNEVLKQVRDKMLLIHRNQEVSFESIVNKINPKRGADIHPIFQVGFTFEHPPYIDIKDLDINTMVVHSGGSQLLLFSRFWESQNEIHGYFEYPTDVFKPSTIERLEIHYRELVKEILHNSEMPVSRLKYITQSEKQQLLVDWNSTEKNYRCCETIPELLEQQVNASPNATALVFKETSLTYSELNARINQMANFLIDHGVERGFSVGIYMERSLEMVINIHAILKAGGVYVPLDPEYPRNRISAMIRNADIQLVLTQRHLIAQLSQLETKPVIADSVLNEEKQYSSENPSVVINPDDAAYIIHTSGSTGIPKGVVNCHQGVSNRILWMQDQYPLKREDTVLQKTPFSFDVSVWEFIWPLITGAKLVVAPPMAHKDPDQLLNLIHDNQVTTIHFVPSMLRIFLNGNELERCQCLKRVFCSGEALTGVLRDCFFSRLDAELHNLYGPTEAAIDVTYWQCHKNDTSDLVPIGKPVANTKMYILDQDLQPVPVGITGELYIGGVQVAKGYINDEERTKLSFIPDPFDDKPNIRLYKTGDLGRFLSDGNIEYIGRVDSQVKVNGVRIELGEIESEILKYPEIQNVKVIIKDFDIGDRRIIAYVASKNPQIINGDHTEYIKRALLNQLPEFMVPSLFIFMEHLPLNKSGKIDGKSLPEPSFKLQKSLEIQITAENELEEELVVMWSQVLKLEQVGVEDNFFDIGGNSLLAADLATRIGKRFGGDSPLLKIFQYPTIRSFASYLNMESNNDDSYNAIIERAKLKKKTNLLKSTRKSQRRV